MDPVWEQLFSAQEWGKYPPEHVIRFVARNFYGAPKRQDVKLLEVGCGPGANVWYAASEGFDVSAIDGSPSAVRKARDRLQKAGLDANLKVGDFCGKLPWPDETFDGVIENLSLYTNRRVRIKQAISEIRRVLKPKGKFQSCWFNAQTWGYGLGNEVEPGGFERISEGPLKDRGFCLFVQDDDIKDFLQGFNIESMETVSRSMQNRSRQVSELVVVATRQ
jgi:SAM-dependent methyltransferase